MPKNPEKFTSSDQSQKLGKLTPEEIKEMVKKYKEEHEGLLPEYFSLPGEEKEEEREYSEETILAYEIKEFLEKIRPELENKNFIKNAGKFLKFKIEFSQKPGKTGDSWEAVCYYIFFKQSDLWSKLDQELRDWIEENIKDPQLIKNAGEYLKSEIESGQKPGNTKDAWYVVNGYASFKQSDLWSKLDQELRDWIEENIKDPQLIKNAGEYLKSEIESGQKLIGAVFAVNAICAYVLFSQFQKILEEQGRKKEIAKETEKAMHPEKKLPPIPEEKAF
jgi:uncharacterized protein (DUF736 family)